MLKPLLVALGAALVLLTAGGGTARAAVDCDRYAAADGSDANTGASPAQAVATVNRLLEVLANGQTGCLKAGDVFDDEAIAATTDIVWLRFTGSSTARDNVTITSTSETTPATIDGRVEVHQDRTGVTLQNLVIDATSFPTDSPAIRMDGQEFSLLGSRVRNATNDRRCIQLGGGTLPAQNTRIVGNQIYDCGTGAGGSGIGLDETSGAQIEDNQFARIDGRAVQLYPNADGSQIENNVFRDVEMAVQFAGTNTEASENNLALGNVGAEVRIGGDLFGSNFGTPRPTLQSNRVRQNCLPNDGTAFDANAGSHYAQADNRLTTPTFASGVGVTGEVPDMRPATNSPCGVNGAAGTDRPAGGYGPRPGGVATLAATAVTRTGATLRATLDPRLFGTSVRFEYGEGEALNRTTGAVARSGGAPVTVSIPVTGLSPERSYSFRVVTTNGNVVVRGAVQRFTTPLSGDSDGDGVRDTLDRCNGEVPVLDTRPRDGCKDDVDDDNVPDEDERERACVDAPGTTGADVNPKDGCRDDPDGDGIPRAPAANADECPNENGLPVDSRPRDGCKDNVDRDARLDERDDCITDRRPPNDSDADGCDGPYLEVGVPATRVPPFRSRDGRRVRLEVNFAGLSRSTRVSWRCLQTCTRRGGTPRVGRDGRVRFSLGRARFRDGSVTFSWRVTLVRPGRIGRVLQMRRTVFARSNADGSMYLARCLHPGSRTRDYDGRRLDDPSENRCKRLRFD